MAFRRPPHGSDTRRVPATASDELLLQACRDGDTEAFALLFRRHHVSVARIAAATTSRFDAEDLAAESFTRIWAAIREGHGPTGAFLPYARTVVRNVAATWAGRTLEDPAEPDQLAAASQGQATTAGFEDALSEHQLVSSAFATLPERWQSVLWMTEVEGRKAADVASELGLSPNAAAALSKRAREALGRAWLQAQVDTRGKSGECQWVLGRVGGHVRRTLSAQQESRVAAHLESCESCERATRKIAYIGSSLRLVALLAGGTAAGLAAWTVGAATPAFAAGAGVLPPAPVAPNPAGSVVRGALKQVGRNLSTVPGAVVAGVAAAAIAVAAVTLPGLIAANSRDTESAGSTVNTVTNPNQLPAAPQPATTPPDGSEPGAAPEDAADDTDDSVDGVEPLASLTGQSDEPPAKRNPSPADKPDRDPAPIPKPPKPVDPSPTDPEPTNPDPTNPTDPTDPTDPDPTDPDPTNPDPIDPDPTNPTDPENPPDPADPDDPDDAEDPTHPPDTAGSALAITSTRLMVGQPLVVSWKTDVPHGLNWIGIYPPSAGIPDGNPPSTRWQYTPGPSGTVSFEGLAAGTWLVYFLAQDGYGQLCEPVTIIITAEPEPGILEPVMTESESESVAIESEAAIPQPKPAATDPEPAIADPALTDPGPVAIEPEPAIAQPEPVATEPEPAAAPAASQPPPDPNPEPAPTRPAPDPKPAPAPEPAPAAEDGSEPE